MKKRCPRDDEHLKYINVDDACTVNITVIRVRKLLDTTIDNRVFAIYPAIERTNVDKKAQFLLRGCYSNYETL